MYYDDSWAILYLIFLIVNLVGIYKLYEKAGEPGIMALIPIVNLVYMAKIAKVPAVTLFFMLIPFVNIGYALYLSYKFVESYGGGIGLYLGYLFLSPIVIPYMAFSSNVEYVENK